MYILNLSFHPTTKIILQIIALLIVLIPILFYLLDRTNSLKKSLKTELYQRYYSWLFLIPGMILPLLLGREWVAIASFILGVACIRELHISAQFETNYLILCYTGIIWLYICWYFNWYLGSVLSIFFILIMIKFITQPKYSSLNTKKLLWRYWGFLLIILGVSHIFLLTRIENYQPLILLLLLCTELNDIFAFTCGKLFGRHKLTPNISPKKTVEGAFGAIVLTTLLFSYLLSTLLEGNIIFFMLAGIGLSISGQIGDILFSIFKRTFTLKDTGSLIPGHGGILDRFDSLMVTAPFYYYILIYYTNAQFIV